MGLIWTILIGFVVGVLATPLRRQLASPWLWAGVALSLLVFAPNAWWQWQHDFVYLDFVEHIHARDVRIGRRACSPLLDLALQRHNSVRARDH